MDKISGEKGWISLRPWGGKGGKDWAYKPDGPIMKITIWSRDFIDQILFESKSSDGVVIGDSVKIGKPGIGGCHLKTLCIDSLVEQLSSISLTYGHYYDRDGIVIESLCLETNIGNKYGPFSRRTVPFSMSIPIEGGVITGFHGRAGSKLRAIGIFVAPKVNSLPSSLKNVNSLCSIQDPDSTPTQPKGKISGEEGWISLGPWGGLSGEEYWDYKPDGPLMQITIGYDENLIISVLFESKSYDGVIIGSSVKVAGTTGDGRWTKTFCIDSSVEQLSSISLTYDLSNSRRRPFCGAVNTLCFETNSGNKYYGPFGEKTGSQSLSIPTQGGVITGFHGRAGVGSGSWLNSIGIFVAPNVNSLPCLGKKVDSLHSIQDPDSAPIQLKGKISDDEGFISLGPWGGKYGGDWTYKANGPIIQISICFGEAINSICFQSRSRDGLVIGSSEKFGGTGDHRTKTNTV